MALSIKEAILGSQGLFSISGCFAQKVVHVYQYYYDDKFNLAIVFFFIF
jgi:hypothetical protein